MRQPKRSPHKPDVELLIESMDDQARGVARLDGKVVFVSGALPGERVRARYTRVRGRYDEARTVDVLEANAHRVTPRCLHFNTCGGCTLQHLDVGAQRELKAERLAENLSRLGNVAPLEWAPPLVASPWHYRHRARLAVKFVPKKGGVRVGFRERQGHQLAAIDVCHVMHAAIGLQLDALRERLARLQLRARIPQIEVAMADDGPEGTPRGVLTVRHLEPLPDTDVVALKQVAAQTGLSVYLQAGGPETIVPLDEPCVLTYALPAQGIELGFEPADFTQVNPQINRLMVSQALDWLQPESLDGVLDLFCGIGNFTLPVAQVQSRVLGVEGIASAVERAAANAHANGLAHCAFEVGDLNDEAVCRGFLGREFEGLLLDPPRAGAAAAMAALNVHHPRRIVYVSCSPASLARDLDTLVNQHGYALLRVGIMDMFPHTNHVESMALLERG